MVKTFSRLITKVNRKVRTNKKNEWIVLHYVGAESTAENNAKYFEKENRGASAHYFVDETSIWQVVEDKDEAWHVGGAKKYYNSCRNSNSIGIEMCCKKKDGQWYIEPETVNNALWLTKTLCKKYGLTSKNVTTHNLTTGKACPEPWVRNPKEWENFIERLDKEMADVPEISIVDKEQRIKDVFKIESRTIDWFEDYKYGLPWLIDKLYVGATDAAKWRKYLANGGKDIEL